MIENYNAGLYCRLSREDENNTSQSESIKNQIEFLTKYIVEKGWNIVDIYVDDGYSGTSFDRPAFKRMIEDIESGKINLVVTKDLSRLGRDYIETGRYMERYFPEKNVRYIAVNDGIDTFTENGNNDMSPFKSVINDMYAKDISKKVRSVFKVKVASGKFIGAFAPYGYKKDSLDNSRLVIDDVVASAVRSIFRMYIEGKGLTNIAHTLNSEGLPNPTAYKATLGNYKNSNSKIGLWEHSTIKVILSNPTYAGNLAQNKFRKVNYKSKKHLAVDRANWVVVENTHEPIITMIDFELVQAMLHRRSSANVLCKKSAKPLSGFVFCGDCGEYMTFHDTPRGTEYLICSKYKRYTSKYCSRHAIKVDDLQASVLEDIRVMIKSVINNEEIVSETKIQTGSRNQSKYEKELNLLSKKITEINNTIKSLYVDKVRGILSEQDFMEFNKSFSVEKDVLILRHNELQKLKERQSEQASELDTVQSIVDSISNASELTREILEKLVEKIEIFEDSSIKITYKFKNPFEDS